MTAVTLDGIRTARGAFTLGPIDLHVPAGSIVGLLGASGCGKTTLLDVVAGLAEVDAGSVRLGEKIVTTDRRTTPPHDRGVAMLGQDTGLWPHLDVRSNVGLVAADRKSTTSVDAWLARVGAEDLADRSPADLSGGEARRVGLARILAASASVILLDEPGAHLDPSAADDLAAVMREDATSRGATMIVAAHDLGAVAAYRPDHLAVLADGRLLRFAPTGEVVDDPGHRTVEERVRTPSAPRPWWKPERP